MARIKDLDMDTRIELPEIGRTILTESSKAPYFFTWEHCGLSILQIPEYFIEYPFRIKTEAVRNLMNLEAECSKEQGQEGRQENTMYDWMRCGPFTATQSRINRKLNDSVQRILKLGIIDEQDIEDSYFTWYRRAYWKYLGACYMKQRLVAINPVLDYRAYSQTAFDKVVYHEILHLRQQRNGHSSRIYHTRQFREWEKEYPYYNEAVKELRSTAIPDLSDRRYPPLDLVPNGTTYGNEDAFIADDGKPILDLSGFNRYSGPEEQIYVSFSRLKRSGCYYDVKHHPSKWGRMGIMEIILDARLLESQKYLMELVSEDIVRFMNYGVRRQNPTVVENITNVFNPNSEQNGAYKQTSLDDILHRLEEGVPLNICSELDAEPDNSAVIC